MNSVVEFVAHPKDDRVTDGTRIESHLNILTIEPRQGLLALVAWLVVPCPLASLDSSALLTETMDLTMLTVLGGHHSHNCVKLDAVAFIADTTNRHQRSGHGRYLKD